MRRAAIFSLVLPPLLLLTGCGVSVETASTAPTPGVAITGNVHGGRQPIVGSRVYLLAASTAGYGSASTSLLTLGINGTDTIGGYVLTGAGGSFSLSGDYVCTPGQQVYLLAMGGNPSGTASNTINNTAIGLMTAFGTCPSTGTLAGRLPNVSINELTTVAAAFALAGYTTDASHMASSGSAQAQTGVANAMLTAQNLVSPVDGYGHAVTPAGNGRAPLPTEDTLANILAACVNNNLASASNCTNLFGLARSAGATGTLPTETATAILNIAHHPGTSTSALYMLTAGTAAPYQPTLSGTPNDFSLSVVYPFDSFEAVFDASGNLWTPNATLFEYSNMGVLLSPAGGYTGGVLTPYANTGTVYSAQNVAIDPSNNVWATSSFFNNSTQANGSNNFLIKISNSGTALSPSTGYTGGGLNQPGTIAIDGVGNVFIGNSDATVSQFTNAGVAASPTAFATGGQANAIDLAVDGAGNLWDATGIYVPGTGTGNGTSYYSLMKLSNTGTVLATPATTLREYTHLSVDAGNNIWGTTGYQNGSTQIFRFTSTGASITGFPLTGNTGAKVCLQTQIDGDGNLWCASEPLDSISEVSPNGTSLSPDRGYGNAYCLGASYLAIDSSGNVWVTNGYDPSTYDFANMELIGAAAPVVTPLSLAIQLGKLGARP